jgi:hypothetical protein
MPVRGDGDGAGLDATAGDAMSVPVSARAATIAAEVRRLNAGSLTVWVALTLAGRGYSRQSGYIARQNVEPRVPSTLLIGS